MKTNASTPIAAVTTLGAVRHTHMTQPARAGGGHGLFHRVNDILVELVTAAKRFRTARAHLASALRAAEQAAIEGRRSAVNPKPK
jgi:hypothetical protein